MVALRPLRSVLSWRSPLPAPVWIAGALSLGFHGLLFAASPRLSNLSFDNLANPEALGAERVSLIELSPEEQQRLPDFSSSRYGLSPLDPLETPWPEGFDNGGFSGNPGGLYSTPGGFDFPPYAGFSYTPPPTVAGRPRLDLPSRQIPQGGAVQGNPTLRLPGAVGVGPVPQTLPRGGTGDGSGIPESILVPSSPPGGNPAPATPSPTPSHEPGAAALEQRPPTPANPTGSAPTLSTELLRSLAHDGGTPPELAQTAAQTWQTESRALVNGAEFPVERAAMPILSLVNGQQPCLAPAPQEGLVAVLVAPGGRLLRDPQVLISTGYPFVNQRAIDRIKGQNFRSVQQLTAYEFQIEVVYDGGRCVELKEDGTWGTAPGERLAPIPPATSTPGTGN